MGLRLQSWLEIRDFDPKPKWGRRRKKWARDSQRYGPGRGSKSERAPGRATLGRIGGARAWPRGAEVRPDRSSSAELSTII